MKTTTRDNYGFLATLILCTIIGWLYRHQHRLIILEDRVREIERTLNTPSTNAWLVIRQDAKGAAYISFASRTNTVNLTNHVPIKAEQ